MNASIRSNRQFSILCYTTLITALAILVFTVILSLANTTQSCSSMHSCQHQLSATQNARVVLVEYPTISEASGGHNNLQHVIQSSYYIGIYILIALTILLCFLSYRHHATFSRPTLIPSIIALLLFAQFGVGIWSIGWQSITTALIIHFILAIAIITILWLLVLISKQKPGLIIFI